MKESAAQIRLASDQLSQSFDKGVAEVSKTVKGMSAAIETLAKNVNVQINSADLANIGGAATENLKDALIELSKNWEFAVNTADLKDIGAEAAKHLSLALQNLNLRIEVKVDLGNNTLAAVHQTVDELGNSIRSVSKELGQSLQMGAGEVGSSVRELAKTVSDLGKSVSVKLNSGDLANIGDAATRNLKEALEALSKEWELAVNTADLKDIGAEASRHLSLALQNLNFKIEVYFRVDQNVVTAIGYLSIAGSIAFSVLFIAILISLKKCRSCVLAIFNICTDERRSCCCRRNADSSNQAPSMNTTKEGESPPDEEVLTRNPTKIHENVHIYDEIQVDRPKNNQDQDHLKQNKKRFTLSLAGKRHKHFAFI